MFLTIIHIMSTRPNAAPLRTRYHHQPGLLARRFTFMPNKLCLKGLVSWCIKVSREERGSLTAMKVSGRNINWLRLVFLA